MPRIHRELNAVLSTLNRIDTTLLFRLIENSTLTPRYSEANLYYSAIWQLGSNANRNPSTRAPHLFIPFPSILRD